MTRDVDKCAMPTGRGRSCGQESGVIYCGVGICDHHWDQCAEEITPEDFQQRQILAEEARSEEKKIRKKRW
jgi:hypothetical protein